MAHRTTRPLGTAPGHLDASFTAELFGHLHRTDQRRWAHGYLQGLLLTPGKKTVRRLAATVFDSPTASQSLQQFVNSSPWQWGPARAGLTRWTERRLRPHAWTLGTAVLPKRGDRSVGVHRRFDPALGRTVNCQLGLGLFLSGSRHTIPVDWRLHLPANWTDDPDLRDGARIPATTRHEPLWAHAADLVDTLAARTTLGPAPLVADPTGFLDPRHLLAALDARDQDYVLGIPADLPLTVDTRHARHDRPGPTAVAGAHHLLGIGRTRDPEPVTVAAADGSRRRLHIRSAQVRLVQTGTEGRAPERGYRIFTAREPGTPWPARVWISNLLHRRIDELLALARLSDATAQTVRTLETDFGLQDFEGRSYPGWHHHMTLVSAAYAHHRLHRLHESPDHHWSEPPNLRIA